MLTPDPKYPELRRRRFRPIPVRMLVPNVITLLAICAGLTAIRLSIEGRMELAVAAIVFAAVLDGVDGRVARMIKGQSKFGAELDSLADFVNFGVAPALILYFWGLSEIKSVGWIAALVFAICAALRLARFNVMIDDPNKPPYAANYFTGVPAPMGAILAMLPGARIIACQRDPLETCFACYRQMLDGNEYTHDFDDLAGYWHDFDRAVRHWHAVDPQRVRLQVYEELVADSEQQTRALLDFCNLPFDPACLRFYETERRARTPSASQVRQPIRRDTARTARYGATLDPLRAALRRVGARFDEDPAPASPGLAEGG